MCEPSLLFSINASIKLTKESISWNPLSSRKTSRNAVARSLDKKLSMVAIRQHPYCSQRCDLAGLGQRRGGLTAWQRFPTHGTTNRTIHCLQQRWRDLLAWRRLLKHPRRIERVRCLRQRCGDLSAQRRLPMHTTTQRSQRRMEEFAVVGSDPIEHVSRSDHG